MSGLGKCYSTNEENFDFTDRWEAVDHEVSSYTPEEFMEETGGIIYIWEGDLVPFKASDFLSSNFIEDMAEAAYDQVGEIAEDWLTASILGDNALFSEVKKAIDLWADEYKQHPYFYDVANIKQLKVKIIDPENLKYEVLDDH